MLKQEYVKAKHLKNAQKINIHNYNDFTIYYCFFNVHPLDLMLGTDGL